ncbi:restriction endonuclease subunit S [Thioalkalivibrio sp. ALJ15]|uniref:restriction endonuclease subunit S n=1 Tax=Thioalkalivibrio sp. ALJ15 TaxID=748652 RepID=UPI000363D196|nr:restriction endonuclease subunit S [Thioalkalivibrio sp. ALJ15]
MSDQSWPVIGLEELFTINTDGVVPNSSPNTEFYHHSLPAWDQFGGPVVEKGSSIESNKTKVAKPCVLVSKLNPRKPRVSIVKQVPDEERHCASTEFVCLEPKSEEPLSFWNHLFSNKSFSDSLDRLAIGSTNSHKRFSPKELFRQRIELPSWPERRLIARILDTLDTQIQKTEALIAKLEKVKEGLLHDLLTRGIDENGQLRPSPEQAPELYKESPLGRIPREWSVAPLGNVSEIVSGVTLGSKSGNSAWPLVPYLRVANVQDGYLDLSEVKLIRVNPDHIEKYRLHPGDVLMNEGGDFDKLGRGTLWRGEIELCVHQNHVFRVRTDGRVLDPYFLASFSASFSGKRYFVKSSKQSTNLASINSTQLKAFEVPLPSIEEQGVIVDKLQVMADRIEHEKSHLSKLAAHKAGLMDDLLTGRVRVTPLLDQAEAATPA